MRVTPGLDRNRIAEFIPCRAGDYTVANLAVSFENLVLDKKKGRL